MSVRYRRVSQVESVEEESKKSRAEIIERITAKIHAVFWVVVALIVVIVTDFLNLIFSNKINRFARNLAIICLIANTGIMLYLTIYLPLIKKITAPWDIYCPSMIPISTGLGIAFCFLLIIALWPVWGMLSPLYVMIIVLGIIFSTHFIPWPC